jgi:hypothetical protein
MRVVVRPHDTLAPCEWFQANVSAPSGVALLVANRCLAP